MLIESFQVFSKLYKSTANWEQIFTKSVTLNKIIQQKKWALVIRALVTGLFSAPSPHLNFNFEKQILHCHNVMKFCMVNKLTTVNTFFLHSLISNITHSAIITRKTIFKMESLKWGDGKSQKLSIQQLAHKKICQILFTCSRGYVLLQTRILKFI